VATQTRSANFEVPEDLLDEVTVAGCVVRQVERIQDEQRRLAMAFYMEE